MKAAVCREPGKPLTIEDIEIDPPQTGEVKVRVKAVAVCHSDVHLIQGDWGNQCPLVAGHEAAGIVEEVGDNVRTVKPGDRVVASLLRSCGFCFYCSTGAPHMCNGNFALDRETRLHDKNGNKIAQGLRTASFAEYMIADQSQLVKLPDDMPFESSALLACGVMTGVGAVINTANVETGSSVVIMGLGGVGLSAVQGAKLAAACPIVAVDVLDEKLKDAKEFGATHTVNSKKADVVKTVQELTGGLGADYVFVTVGNMGLVAEGLKMIRRRGTIVIVGVPPHGTVLKLPAEESLIFFEARIMGCGIGSARIQVDIPRLVRLYQDGRLKLDELISKRYSLDQINEAIADMLTGKARRNVVML